MLWCVGLMIVRMTALKIAVPDFLQSPHCVNYPLHVRSSGPGASVYKIMRNTLSSYHMQRIMCHVMRRDSSAIKFDRAEIIFILALFFLAEPLVAEGGEETRVPGENPWQQASEVLCGKGASWRWGVGGGAGGGCSQLSLVQSYQWHKSWYWQPLTTSFRSTLW